MSKTFKMVMAIALTLCVAFTMPLGTLASEQSSEAEKSIIRVELIYKASDDVNDAWIIQSNTGFLINDSYAVTSSESIVMDKEMMSFMMDVLGVSEEDFLDRCSIRISNQYGDLIEAYRVHHRYSALAVLHLDHKLLNGRAPKLRSSSELSEGEKCSALWLSVDTPSWRVNTSFSSVHHAKNGADYLKLDEQVTIGSCGGPLLDASGNVIGVMIGTSEGEYSAISSDVLMNELEGMGVGAGNN